MTPEEFRTHGHDLIDWIADYRSSLTHRRVMSTVEPGSIAEQLPVSAPEVGGDPAELLSGLDSIVMPGLTHWQHPRFFNFFPANSELSSVLGDIASSGLGVLGLSWESAPALSEIEQRTIDWTRQLFGLPESFRGVIQDTASTSTLLAMLEAREKASNFSMAGPGLTQDAGALTVYLSEYAHSSVRKAVLLAGFGDDNIHHIEVDEDFAMKPDALAAAIAEDRVRGRIPAAVVATCGTTTTTGMDPLSAIGDIAETEDLWFHVDAAMAGSALILPEFRHLAAGIEKADSLVVNVHKWFGVAFDCSLYFIQDTQHLERVMSTDPSYLQSSKDAEVTNLRDWGVPLGRRFRSLKLWFMLHIEGAEAIRTRLRRDLANAKWFAEQVAAHPDWSVVAPVPLQTVCIRHEPAGMSPDQLDAHTKKWARSINESGAAYVSLSTLEGRWMVRISIGALSTERSDVEALWELLQDAVT